MATECLEDFQRLGSIVGEARTYHTLARIEFEARENFWALEFAMRGFKCLPRSVDPVDCAITHEEVAMIWHQLDRENKVAEHWLAALVIRLASGIPPKRSLTTLQQYRQSNFRRVRGTFKPCSITQLIEKADFLPLGRWLPTLNVSIEVLQERVERILDQNPDDPDPMPPRRPPDSGAPPAAAALLAEFPLANRQKQTG